MNRPTLKELSAKTGLSIATISRALSGSPLVKPETKSAIDKAARELQNRSTDQSGLIGLVIPDTRNPFFPLMYGIYPYVHPTDKQNKAMKKAGIVPRKTSVYEIAYKAIIDFLSKQGGVK